LATIALFNHQWCDYRSASEASSRKPVNSSTSSSINSWSQSEALEVHLIKHKTSDSTEHAATFGYEFNNEHRNLVL
jgi:hypothetical protein